MNKLLVSLSLIIAGCSASSVKVISPSGNDAYSIECKLSVQSCYKMAGELCPNGYSIIDDTTENLTNPKGQSISFHHLMVECK